MAKINDEVLDILKQCLVDGFKVQLPKITLDRKLYQSVAKELNLIGGKWMGGKTQAFVFEQNPAKLLDVLINGDRLNLKKEYQFFATPSQLAIRLVQMADIKADHAVLEPSAGMVQS